jgi:hypothetical protein
MLERGESSARDRDRVGAVGESAVGSGATIEVP